MSEADVVYVYDIAKMVNNAIKCLNERNGSSFQAIINFFSSNYEEIDVEKFAPFIRKYLKNAVLSGQLVQTKLILINRNEIHISDLTYEEARDALKALLENVIRDAVVNADNGNRKKVNIADVVYALKRQGHTLYGFGAGG